LPSHDKQRGSAKENIGDIRSSGTWPIIVGTRKRREKKKDPRIDLKY